MITLFDSPNLSDLKTWADELSLTAPVASDYTFQISDDYNPDGATPSMSLIGPGAELLLRDADSFTEADLLQFLGP